MSADKLEQLLDAGGEVRLARRDAHEVLQKLRARGAGAETAALIEAQLAQGDEPVVLAGGEAHRLLEELRASGRRWISGTDAPREPPAAPEPEPELRQGWKFWNKA
jgi:hypothetical protein